LVVKANAYGHGLVPISIEAVKAGIDMLGVATIGEAETLQTHGIGAPILIMCAIDDEELRYCVAKRISFMASRIEQIHLAQQYSRQYGVSPAIHLEIDIGMSRSGFDVQDLGNTMDSMPNSMLPCIAGICGHFSSADLESVDQTESQLAAFLSCRELVLATGLKPLFHVANSPGTLRFGRSRLDMVRLGIAAYGLPPSEHTPLPEGLAPILSWKARLTNVKQLPPSRGVGYGSTYVTTGTEVLGTFAIGYADGYRRVPKGINTVLLGGIENQVVGSVFMDQCVVRVDNSLDAAIGDTVVLLGRQLSKELSAELLAERWGTNNYDVVAGIRDRVPRIYHGRS
jgi:alanine racemase